MMTKLIYGYGRAPAIALVVSALFAIACGKGSAPARSTGEKAADDMKGMPGMESKDAAASHVTLILTAAQIAHGGVRWAPVDVGTAAARAVVPGEVVPNEDRTERLGAPGRGRVIDVRVRPGDHVAAGQVLVTLQSTEAGMAQADIAKAAAEQTSRRAQSQFAAAAKDRAERLLALKAIPRQDYERALSDDEQARAALAQADAELLRARTTAGQLGAGDVSSSGEIMIRARRSAVVLTRSAVPGTVVDAGAPLVVLTDPASLWLSINTPEQFAGLLRRGNVVRFTVPAFASDTFSARIDGVGAGLDPDTRTLAVRATIANAGGRLKPAMLANAIVEGAPSVGTMMVPEDAVQLIQGKPNAFLATPDGKGGARIERREVELGQRSGGRVAIVRGLARGEIVVVAGAFAVKAEFQKASMPKMEM